MANEKPSLPDLRQKAEKGNAEAQFKLGMMYRYDEEAFHDDAEALKWLLQAAEQDYAEAQFHLGLMYQSGKGIEQDNAEAMKWIRKAAENNGAGCGGCARCRG